MDILNFAPKKFGLSNNQLKIIAIISMFLDHFGLYLFPNVIMFRILGRIALPIFAYMIAEGCLHTKNRVKYLLHLFILGLGCQIVFFIVSNSIYQGILMTFSVSIILIYAIDYFLSKKNILSFLITFLTIATVIFVAGILPTVWKKSGFNFDYGMLGIFLPVAIYYSKYKLLKLLSLSIFIIFMAIEFTTILLYSFLALPLLFLYNNERGKCKLKYLFYIFYPVHLVFIFLLKYLI